MNWNSYFTMMADWKRLPAYKAEPRIDSLIGHYLKQILSDFLKQQIVEVIPELPVRLGTVKPKHEGTYYSDRSYKVDFYALEANGINYLVEFKTDSSSRREAQDTYLKEAQSIGMKRIAEGVCKIASVSSYEEKYNHLLDKMKGLGLLGPDGTFNGKSDKIEIVYIQPSKKTETSVCIDFHWLADWFVKTFPDQEFEKELAAVLRKWAID